MNCKDCLHYEAHKHFFKSNDYEKDFDDYFKDDDIEHKCPEFLPLPRKIGDTIYEIDNGGKIYESKIRNIIYNTTGIAFDETAIGKSVYLTRESAKKALAERGRK